MSIKLLPEATFSENGFLHFVKHKPLRLINTETNETIKRVEPPVTGWDLVSIREACDLCDCQSGKYPVDAFVGDSWNGSNEI